MKEKTVLGAYPGVGSSVLLCLLFVGIQIAVGGILGFVIGLLGYGADSFAIGLATMAGTLLAFAVVLIIGFKKTKLKFNEVFKFNGVSPALWCAVIIFMLGFLFVLSEIDNLINYILPMPEALQDVFKTVTVDQLFVVGIVLIGIIPALFEELLFRGLILDGLNRNYTPVKAIVISSLLFGIVHLNPWQFVTAFLIGLFSAWICIRSKSILLSMYIHLFNNLVYLIMMKYGDSIPLPGFNNSQTLAREFQPVWLDIAAVAVTLLGLFLLKREFDKNDVRNKPNEVPVSAADPE
jgi:membrane protease YdiL (CAAX protease family)